MRSGLVTLAGRSNVGKSTLLNALVGTKVAATSPKPQTTRQAIRGIYTDARGQIVFIDTPGIFESNRGTVTRAANAEARESLRGVDAIVYVVDPTRAIGTEEHRIQTLLRAQTVPKIVVYNKSDLPARSRPHQESFERLIADSGFDRAIAISALKQQHLKPLLDALFDVLPEGEPLYPADQRADIPKEQWIAELIREKIFLVMTDEIPYTTTVVVDELAERENGVLVIAARIITTDDRYRKMLIGRNAARVKQIGQMARRDLEIALHHQVFLDLHVTVGSWDRY